MQFTMGKHTRVPTNGDSREVAGPLPAVDNSWLRFVNDPAGLQNVEFSSSKPAIPDVLDTDGGTDSAMDLAGFWVEWARQAAALGRRTGPSRLDRSDGSQVNRAATVARPTSTQATTRARREAEGLEVRGGTGREGAQW